MQAVDHAQGRAVAEAHRDDPVEPAILRRSRIESRTGSEIIGRGIDVPALVDPIDDVRRAMAQAPCRLCRSWRRRSPRGRAAPPAGRFRRCARFASRRRRAEPCPTSAPLRKRRPARRRPAGTHPACRRSPDRAGRPCASQTSGGRAPTSGMPALLRERQACDLQSSTWTKEMARNVRCLARPILLGAQRGDLPSRRSIASPLSAGFHRSTAKIRRSPGTPSSGCWPWSTNRSPEPPRGPSPYRRPSPPTGNPEWPNKYTAAYPTLQGKETNVPGDLVRPIFWKYKAADLATEVTHQQVQHKSTMDKDGTVTTSKATASVTIAVGAATVA